METNMISHKPNSETSRLASRTLKVLSLTTKPSLAPTPPNPPRICPSLPKRRGHSEAKSAKDPSPFWGDLWGP